MYLIKPSVELWPAPEDWHEQVARAARLCYASEGGKKTAEEFCEMLKKRNHLSMFRHGSRYFIISDVVPSELTNATPSKGGKKASSQPPLWLFTVLTNTPYVGIRYHKDKKAKTRCYYISTNIQYLMDSPSIEEMLRPYEVTLQQFIDHATSDNFPAAMNLVRYTVCVTTQISTSRELNRTSPNNIAEQSTRYVNFGKKGGITICLPHWFQCAHWSKRLLARVMWKCSEWAYKFALLLGLPAQDARGFLVLDAGTRVAYTYNVFEWRNIMRLRLTGETGKPHPNAHIVAQLIHDAILPAMRIYAGEAATLV